MLLVDPRPAMGATDPGRELALEPDFSGLPAATPEALAKSANEATSNPGPKRYATSAPGGKLSLVAGSVAQFALNFFTALSYAMAAASGSMKKPT
jgi:hypothetical protein